VAAEQAEGVRPADCSRRGRSRTWNACPRGRLAGQSPAAAAPAARDRQRHGAGNHPGPRHRLDRLESVALTMQSRETVWVGYRPTGAIRWGRRRRCCANSPACGGALSGARLRVTGSGAKSWARCERLLRQGGGLCVERNRGARRGRTVPRRTRRHDFEIGGQDAKYIRLAGGRVVDCAMNEAAARHGSFIAEQAASRRHPRCRALGREHWRRVRAFRWASIARVHGGGH